MPMRKFISIKPTTPTILRELSSLEHVTVVVFSAMLALFAMLGILQCNFAAMYPDFIIGNITWIAAGKIQDLLAGPIFVAVFFCGWKFLTFYLSQQQEQARQSYLLERLYQGSRRLLPNPLLHLPELSNNQTFAATWVSFLATVAVVWLCAQSTKVVDSQDWLIIGDYPLKQSMLAVLAVVIFGIACKFLILQLAKYKQQFGDDHCTHVATHLIFWNLPASMACLNAVLDTQVDLSLWAMSLVGVVFTGMVVWQSTHKNQLIDVRKASFSLLAMMLIALMPLELFLVLGRTPTSVLFTIDFYPYATSILCVLLACVLLVGLFCLWRYPQAWLDLCAKLMLLGQLGLPVFFLSLCPAKLWQPDFTWAHYKTTLWLDILINGMICWGLWDIVKRYRQYDSRLQNRLSLLSPIALFALVVGLKFSNTEPPYICPDDFHCGERLLGFWLYGQGVWPYIDYLPIHGLLEDDFTSFVSTVFYDGLASSFDQAQHLSFAIGSFLAFMSTYWLVGHVGVAFISIFLIGGRITWLFLTPFVCLWLHPAFIKNPAQWLGVWILTVPVVILGVLAQGMALVVAFGLLAFYQLWRVLRHPHKRQYVNLLLASSILGLLVWLTPFGSMMFGAIRYILENSEITQVAHGIAWAVDWLDIHPQVIFFEVVRMSWLLLPIICLWVIDQSYKSQHKIEDFILPALTVLIFIFLITPYSMSRIDMFHNISRPGMISTFSWCVLLPVVAFRFISSKLQPLVLLLMVCMNASLHLFPLSLTPLAAAATSYVMTPKLQDTQAVGLSYMGHAYVQPEQLQRLSKLQAVLQEQLKPDESYLDLTSRNSQYLFVNRKPPVEISAVYNMVSLAEQKRAVAKLAKNLPRLALLESKNIVHDGGGLAFRNPYLYRFVLEHYSPKFVDGLIVGEIKQEYDAPRLASIESSLKNITNNTWSRGVHRFEPAVIVNNPWLVAQLQVGTSVYLANREVRMVDKIDSSKNIVWLTGGMIDLEQNGYPSLLRFSVGEKTVEDYQKILFQQAFSVKHLGKIPVAWGLSFKSLQKKMSLVQDLANIQPSLSELIDQNGTYRVTGEQAALEFDLSALNLSGYDLGLLSFEFLCGATDESQPLQVSWWGDADLQPTAATTMYFTGNSGMLIVPLDTSPHWLLMRHLKGLRFELGDLNRCETISINKIGLYQRKF